MILSNEERQRILDLYDVYDLIEALNLTATDIVDAFDFKIEDNTEIMEKITGCSDWDLE